MTAIEKYPALTATYRALDLPLRAVDGWAMPAHFTSSAAELQALTERAGLVDVSYFRKLDLKGAAVHTIPALPDGADFWQLSARHALLTSDALDLRSLAGPGLSMVDVTSVFAAFALIGPHSRAVLQYLFALDVSDRAFPDRTCAQSKAAEVHVTLCRKDLGTLPQFLLFFGRDVAVSFRETILHAGHVAGLEPCGQSAYEQLQRKDTLL